jgi:hypothetical protein
LVLSRVATASVPIAKVGEAVLAIMVAKIDLDLNELLHELPQVQ